MTTAAEGMEVLAIPMADRFILYRPLLRMAFVGNKAMAQQVLRLAENGDAPSGQHCPADFLSPEGVA